MSTPASRPLRFGILQMSPVVSGAWWRDRARRVEDKGFSTLLLSDHFDRSPVAPLSAMTAAAAATKRLIVGTLVLNNDLRHPAVLAKELATIALLSDGRLEVGIGAGWMQADYDQMGSELAAPSERIDRLSEAITVLRALFGESTVTHRGHHYRLESMRPEPVGAARSIRILVGGGGRRVLGLAARSADIVSINWNVRAGVMGPGALRSGTPTATDEKLEWIRAAAGDKDPEIHIQCYLLQLTNHPVVAVSAWLRSLGASDAEPQQVVSSPHVLVGTASAVVEKISALRERWGVSYVSFYDRALEDAATIVDRCPP